MGYRAKLSLINFGVWTLSFILFCVSFFTSTYPEILPLSNYRTTTAMIFLVANIVNIVLLVLKTKKERTDERNKRIESLSASITMIMMAVIVYLSSIILYVQYEDTESVPVQWLWFLGYGSFFMVFIVFNLSYVLVSLKDTGYES